MENRDQAQWQVALIRNSDDVIIASLGEIFITVFRARAAQALVRETLDDLLRFASMRPEGIGMITIIRENASFPTHETRQLMAEGFSQMTIVASVTVIEGLGFRAAAVKSVLAGIAKILPRVRPHSAFHQLGEACSWFSEKVSKAHPEWNITPRKLEQALDEFLATL